MEKPDIDKCYKVVIEALEKASKIVLEGHESKLDVKEKEGFYDVVTEYDKRTEECFVQAISKAFPSHKFVGEETASESALTDDPTWIIDPIDGTSNYVHGFPVIGISIAFAFKKEILIGIVCNPISGQTWTAVKGRGAFLNGKRIKTSGCTDLQKSLIGLEISIGSHPKLTQIYAKKYSNCVTKVQGMRCVGSAEIALCLVAMGVWDGFHVDHLKIWDFAAGSIVVTEAGGSMLDTNGGTFNCETGGGIAASTETLGRKLVDIFNV